MRQAVTKVVVGLCLILAPWARGATPPQAGGTGPIPRARRLIDAGNHADASVVLEDALLDAPARDRPAILGLLRQSYEVLARKAETAGRTREATHYRDNLAILDRSRDPVRQAQPIGARPDPPSRSIAASPATAPTPGPVPGPVPPILSEPAPLPEPARIPAPATGNPSLAENSLGASPFELDPSHPRGLTAIPGVAGVQPAQPAPPPEVAREGQSSPRGTRIPAASLPTLPSPESDRDDAPELEINPGSATPDAESNQPDGAAPPPTAPERPAKESDLDRADHLFTARQYDEAGRVYALLAGQNRLPADRRPQWAYCRAAAVVRKINAHPRSTREWDELEAEVREIHQLTPDRWVGEYLRKLVAERRRAVRGPASGSNNLIVRGSEPDDTQAPTRRLPRLLSRLRGATNAPPTPEPPPSQAAPAPEQPLNLLGTAPGSGDDDPATAAPIEWQVHETANFRIFHCDPGLARRSAAVAESVRTTQAKRWNSPAVQAGWSPRCELYLHPNPRSYAEATGQPEVSPGISTMANDGTRVVTRRMNLRADNPTLLTATLPHEVTHIVLADLFVVKQIPRWADEGIAVLAEPVAEQHSRAAELQGPLESGRVFPVGQLMKMDYPDQKDWRLFYAQSVSLTRFLVDQGPPERFLQFVRDSQRVGTEAALRDVYQIDGLDELHNRWVAHARKHVAVDTASSRDAQSQPPSTTR